MTLLPTLRLVPLAASALLLAACHSQADDAAATAVAPIMQGTVSDAMLPVEKATSTPPLAAPGEAADASAQGGKAAQRARPSVSAGAADTADATPAAATDTAPADSGE